MIRRASPDDILRWPDGSRCYRHELHEFAWKSDDYEVITPDSPEYDLIVEEDV